MKKQTLWALVILAGILTVSYGITQYANTFNPMVADLAGGGFAINGISTIDTGQGAVECYAMNQDARTSDYLTFAGLTLTYGLRASTISAGNFIDPSTFDSSVTVNAGLGVTGNAGLIVNTTVYAHTGDFSEIFTSTIIGKSPISIQSTKVDISGGGMVVKNSGTQKVQVYIPTQLHDALAIAVSSGIVIDAPSTNINDGTYSFAVSSDGRCKVQSILLPDGTQISSSPFSSGGAATAVYPGIEIPASSFRTATFGDLASVVDVSYQATFHGYASSMTISTLYLPDGAEPNFGFAQKVVPGTLVDSALTANIIWTSTGPATGNEFLQLSVSTNNFTTWVTYESSSTAPAVAWENTIVPIAIGTGSLFQPGNFVSIMVSRSHSASIMDCYIKGVYIYK